MLEEADSDFGASYIFNHLCISAGTVLETVRSADRSGWPKDCILTARYICCD